MGYLKNHLATMVTGVFAAVLTVLWVWFNGFAPVLDFVFIMAVPISWFLVIVLWLAQMSTDYMHGQGQSTETAHSQITVQNNGRSMETAREDLSKELDSLKKDVKLKDEQIEKLQKQISALKTRVEIELIQTELARLRALASD
ncbi:MAG: hypothetical protein F4Y82_03165 [Cenarchaeum sp. SB0665_bin_23]|nr:hypothetical protein [Cenarchaeum sp. SB0665_bin_23]MXZ93874.1 hypothetical protein [Cenarchaeum sp. SB0666_bin_15]MYB46359.1 hypothetical protein [Cenarchaeum sp. SB0662_bin_33]MYC79864.1 hypothetical protein [Cenarchaeum sp. SB0661_bin_35]MYD58046.1 hypothetical protein [Cenarchaeum sp. SB0678_bin_8]MYG32418.1 hypothetical protein [Cenarchaeum sp. SB0677_bin_16]MYJ27687.1 hypothetical protein [Cenarchaeum sp. SB0672_bin_9]